MSGDIDDIVDTSTDPIVSLVVAAGAIASKLSSG